MGRKGKLSLRIGFYFGQDELLPFQDRQGLVWSICHLVASWPPLAIVLEKKDLVSYSPWGQKESAMTERLNNNEPQCCAGGIVSVSVADKTDIQKER